MPDVVKEDLVALLGLDLAPEEREILFEFTRARQVMDVLHMPGWEHINDLVNSKIDNVELKYLGLKNISKDALFAAHVAQQYVREFWKAVVVQLNTTGDILKDPESVIAKLSGEDAPAATDLEGEVGPQAADMPRFPEDRA